LSGCPLNGAQFIDQARFIGIWRHRVLLQSYCAAWPAPLWISSIKNVFREARRSLKIIRIKNVPRRERIVSQWQCAI
jgi:hypothetical protein